jgi:hypothetical protein
LASARRTKGAGAGLEMREGPVADTVVKRKSRSTAARQAKAGTKAAPAAKTNNPGSSRRPLVVFASLVGVLTVTGGLLMLLAPPPLEPTVYKSLLAAETSQSVEEGVRATKKPLDKWTAVFIHHSRTRDGSALAFSQNLGGVADHFIIGNGDGLEDGELQITSRWSEQKPAGDIPGLQSIEPGCVSICLVGDFSKHRPTRRQFERLLDLVAALQQTCGISADRVYPLPKDAQTVSEATPAGIGRNFPVQQFHRRLIEPQ